MSRRQKAGEVEGKLIHGNIGENSLVRLGELIL